MALIRYPGSKAKLIRSILNSFPSDILNGGGLIQERREYREPFFGSGAIGFEVLPRLGSQCRVRLNDIDRGIACLWQAVKDDPDTLIREVRRFTPSVEHFDAFKAQDGNESIDPVIAGFQKLALHRMSYSGFGVMSGGPLGGKDQSNAKYSVGCRWNPERIAKDIRKCHRELKRFRFLEITCTDFDSVLRGATHNCFIYLDPPYVAKGEELYKHAFTEEDHRRLADWLQRARFQWSLSYDDHSLVRELYGAWSTIKPVWVTYTNALATGKRPKNKELIVTRTPPNAGRALQVQRAALETTGDSLPKGRPSNGSKMSKFDILQGSRAKESGVSRYTQNKLDWLANQRPDLLERVREGELSLDAAFIQSGKGVRKVSVPVDPEKAAGTLRKHFSAEQLQQLVLRLSE